MTNEWDEDEQDAEEFGPGSADYDLSEEHGYTWEATRTDVIPRWIVVVLSVLLVIALVVPSIYIVWRLG